MPDTMPIFSGTICWPDGIDEQIFLDQYWQKKPLLIRQAFPDFETPLPADELAGLSQEADTTGRIITQDDNGAYHLEHGPFDDHRFTQLADNRWSLLVTDVEKHIPEFIAYLQPFRFIPDWRIDDLMISYAPEGASVGAHIDEYDVFLLQGSGIRRWSINSDATAEHIMRRDGDLKILANFTASDTWDLIAGDMLYLPPRMAHYGVAVDDNCTTWSIGFRAPLIPDLIARLAELISDRCPPERYRDAELKPARRGEISSASIQRFKTIWNEATALSDEEFAQLLGCWLSESSTDTLAIEAPETNSLQTARGALLEKAPHSRFAWVSKPDKTATLFVDGSSLDCTADFAEHICASVQYVRLPGDELSVLDEAVLNTLITMGSLLTGS